MFLHGAGGEMQPCRDLFVGDALGHEPEYVGLPVGDAQPGPAARWWLFHSRRHRSASGSIPCRANASAAVSSHCRGRPEPSVSAGSAAQSRARSAQTG